MHVVDHNIFYSFCTSANTTFVLRCYFIYLEYIMYDLVFVDLSLCGRAYYIVYFVFRWDFENL